MNEERILEEFSRMNNELIDTKRELERLNKALEEASLFDKLTGIRNRRGFEELARQQLLVSARQGSPTALIYLDLDRFKAINDRFGHAEGDKALRQAGVLLKACLRAGDIVSRFGGDEFVALLAVTGEEAVATMLGRLEAVTGEWNLGSGLPWKLEFSAGWAIFDPASPEDLEALLARADAAMYRDKARRLGTIDGPQA